MKNREKVYFQESTAEVVNVRTEYGNRKKDPLFQDGKK
jgi:hypothetical protein